MAATLPPVDTTRDAPLNPRSLYRLAGRVVRYLGWSPTTRRHAFEGADGRREELSEDALDRARRDSTLTPGGLLREIE